METLCIIDLIYGLSIFWILEPMVMNMRPLQYLYIFIGKEIDDVWRFDIDLKMLYIVYMDNNKG